MDGHPQFHQVLTEMVKHNSGFDSPNRLQAGAEGHTRWISLNREN